MRIIQFNKLVEEIAEEYEPKETPLVIDAQNFFYNCYKESEFRYECGAECDRYAKYLKDYLIIFKKANIECYFVFKGGTKELEKKIQKVKDNSDGNNLGVNPILVEDIHVQVLKEMGFKFFFSEYESKSDCMALARKLSCPVLSYDIEFPLSGVQYISNKSRKPGTLSCKLFRLENLLQKYNLDKKKLAYFILLTDVTIFPDSTFNSFFKFRRIPIPPKYRNPALLQWLSGSSEINILKGILENTTIGDEEITKVLNEVEKTVAGEVNSEVAINYFFNNYKVTDWFVSGVAANYIAKGYVDLYRSKVLFKQLPNAENYMEPSLSIIKYAFDILTDFKNDGLKFVLWYYDTNTDKTTVIRKTIKKPSCLLNQSIFQIGWDKIRSFDLFQHFISEGIRFDCNKLENVPDDVKMLMITLVYLFYYSKTNPNIAAFTTEMAYGVLLSYVMLNVVKERVDNTRDDDKITIDDCKSALRILEDYSYVKDASEITDKNVLFALKQFQFCLSEMNKLNKLCGSPFEPTCYRKTYNGTFVYKVIKSTDIDEDMSVAFDTMISSAPSVRECFYDMVNIYETCCSQIDLSI